jgi:pimeloyl-ACP methyl ester carboxylesterase
VAQLIQDYQDEHPGRPVYLVGHSGGGALATWILEALPENRAVAGAVLLAPAISWGYPLAAALRKVQRWVWHFWSPLDFLLLGAGTSLVGTLDGRHTASAGLCGFAVPPDADREERELYARRLRQQRYTVAMARQFNLGGHFGWTNRVFVAETLAPLLLQ